MQGPYRGCREKELCGNDEATPNIIFIQADQLAARQLHCYGGKVDSSPTIDRLAREGMRFDRCYTSFPVCLPNRASILTGRSPQLHGLIDGHTLLYNDSPCYAQVIARAGYRVGGFGKFHREGTSGPHPRRLNDLGFHEYVVVEDDKRGPYLDWIRQEHPDYYWLALGRLGKCKGHLTPEQEALREQAREQVFRPLLHESGYRHMFPSPFPAAIHDTTWLTDLGLEFMERHLQRYPGRPFFCQVSYVDPHDPYDPPAPYSRMFDPGEMPAPLPAEFLEQGPAVLNDFNALNCKVIREKNPAVFKRAAALYHGSIRFLDDQVARIVDFLEQKGLAGNTVVLFTTDHGDLMGDHGLMAKSVHYDGSVRVPLLAWGAGIDTGTCNRLVCALDFFPTICDIANVPAEACPPLEGRSLLPACRSLALPDPRQEVAVMSVGMQSVITDDGWRLTRYLETGEGQMFNLGHDPGEQRNLYNEAGLAGKRQELLERLVAAVCQGHYVHQYRNLPRRERERLRLGEDYQPPLS